MNSNYKIEVKIDIKTTNENQLNEESDEKRCLKAR